MPPVIRFWPREETVANPGDDIPHKWMPPVIRFWPREETVANPGDDIPVPPFHPARSKVLLARASVRLPRLRSGAGPRLRSVKFSTVHRARIVLIAPHQATARTAALFIFTHCCRLSAYFAPYTENISNSSGKFCVP